MGQEPLENSQPAAKSGLEQARLELDAAKAKLRDSAAALEPLGFVKKYPLASTGSAFLLGAALPLLRKQFSLLPLLPSLLQATDIISRLIYNYRKN